MPEIVGVDLVGETAQRRLVFRLDRMHAIGLPVGRADLGFELLRIRPDGQARLRRNGGGAHADAAVDRDHALRVAQQRIDVDLGDLGVVGDDLAQLHEHVDDAVDVGRRPIAVALEQGGNAGALDLRARQRRVERRQFERLVADDFDRGAALPEQDHRAEGRVGRNAGDQLIGAGPLNHLLHDEALETRLAARRAIFFRSSAGPRPRPRRASPDSRPRRRRRIYG